MTSSKPLTAHERALVLADAFQDLDFKTQIERYREHTPHPQSYALTIDSPQGRTAVMRIDPDGRIVVWSESKGLDVHALLRKLGIDDFADPGVEYSTKTYSARYVHKISPSPNDVAPRDVLLHFDATRNKTTLARALREQKIISKGDTVRDFRIEARGKIVVFPSGRIMPWHSIILERRDT